jgi:hypothetical protein
MRFWSALAAAWWLAAEVQAPAQTGDEVTLLRTMRAIGDATSGQRLASGAAVDKVVYFGRNGQGQIVVTSVAVLAPGADGLEPPAGTIALVRTRAATAGGNEAPDPADLALARRTGIPIFIVGEWRTPPVIWEVRVQDAGIRIRDVDSQGVPGPWRTSAP